MIKFWKRKKLLVTHDGNFHADDVFAAAILQIYLDQKGERYKIVRTRDRKIIERADFVFDVGEISDASKNRFDHHQKNRAGTRDNGIMYAACGLVWKKFGEEVVGSREGAKMIDDRLQALDAVDNGQDISKAIIPGVGSFSVPSVVGDYNLTWKEDESLKFSQFEKAIAWAKEVMKREIIHTQAMLESEKDILEKYKESDDKRLIILGENYLRYEVNKVLVKLPEPLYFIYPASKDNFWKIECVRAGEDTMASRKPFPETWRGLRGAELEKASGVPGAEFAHDGRFYCRSNSFESALALAQKALSS